MTQETAMIRSVDEQQRFLSALRIRSRFAYDLLQALIKGEQRLRLKNKRKEKRRRKHPFLYFPPLILLPHYHAHPKEGI